MISAPQQRTQLSVGDTVHIIKVRPDGSEGATYDGIVVASPDGWVVAKAYWTFRRLDIGHLVFEPGDYLLEYFSTVEPFNAQALFSGDGCFKGWYCNITYPTFVRGRRVYWHDLFVDVIQQSNGTIFVLDEDELDESGIEHEYPEIHDMILSARDSVVSKMRTSQYPFSEVALQGS
jgi:uncharacterized protein